MPSAAFLFLSPVFLWALPVAAGLPIAAHLWTKSRVKPVPFASLMFLPGQAARQTRITRLDHRLLLALRVLALAAFALAFARPAWQGQAQVTPRGGRKVVLVLDRTASMNQPEGLGTAFDAAKFGADRFLAQLDARSRVALVCADRACAPAWAGWLDPAEARARLAKLALSWEAGDVGRAAQVAQALGPAQVVVWTDGQGRAQCKADAAARRVGVGVEVKVVGEAKDNGWLKREKPNGVGEGKPVMAVEAEGGDPAGEEAFTLALAPYHTSGELGGGWVLIFAGFRGAWTMGRSAPEFLPMPKFEGSRTIASADWSAPELAVFTGVSRAALIGTALRDGVVLKLAPTDRILLRFDDGAPALIARGKTYLLAGSPTGDRHSLAQSPAFVPLVHELVKALLPPPPLPAHPGDALDLPVPVGGRVLSPSGASVTARFGGPGVYRAVDAKGETTATRWCEVAASEVDWRASSPNHREAAAVPGQGWNPWEKTPPDTTTPKGWQTPPPPLRGGESLAQDSRGFTPGQEQASLRDATSEMATAERRAPAELWPACALLALLALLAEPLLIRHAGRRAQA